MNGELLVLHPGAGAAADAPLLLDDASLLVDLDRIEALAVRPVLEDQERTVHHFRLGSRHLQHVDGFVEARLRIDARTETHAERFEKRHRLLLREVLRPVERHVLDEVRQTLLIGLFDDRPDVDHQPQFGALLRPLRRPNEILQAVREFASRDRGIERNLLRERRRLRGGGRQVPAPMRLKTPRRCPP